MGTVKHKLEHYLEFIEENSQYFVNSSEGIAVVSDHKDILDSIEHLRVTLSGLDYSLLDNIGVVYEDEYLWFLCDVVRFQNNRLNLHHRIIRKGGDITGVAILGRFNDGIILLRHYRHPSRRVFLEIPRGGVIEEKTPKESIIQEVEEEIGGSLSKLEELQIIHPSTSIDTASIQCYYGEYKSIGNPSVDEGILEIVIMSPDEIRESIQNGTISDAVTICAFYQSVLRGFV